VVHAAGFKPEFDPARRLWFCDISFDPGQTVSYFPFVRLALARFQPRSVFSADELDSAHLSRVVLSDYVQLAPHRQVEYDLADLQANSRISITVRGPAGIREQRTTVMLVSFARRDPRVPDPQDELGWEEFGDRAALTFNFGGNPEDATWSGAVPVPSGPSPLRVLVREMELFQGDEDAAVVLPVDERGGQPAPGLSDLPRFKTRVVFADALEL
jgi:hypothetical protein